ncbi:MAG: alpha amylase C-terminal domain-containing protein [Bacteroidales bacterium]|nr:alpha amylase C-terminal domain-containing protein [Bacteroidales bacterium]
MKKVLKLIQNDPWLMPYKDAIDGRYEYMQKREKELISDAGSLSDFATGYLYFGLHKRDNQWIFREWAPNATEIYLIGSFNDWKESEDFKLTKTDNGNWEIKIPSDKINHQDLYKLSVHWNGGKGERIPAWADRVVQDPKTYIFSAQVWSPEDSYKFEVDKFVPEVHPLMIYECHIGMAVEDERVGTYNEFRENILPRIAKCGYNAIQIMAIQEHPYYGSFGYHVSSFFAPSSRYGTPDELKQLIDEAHKLGMTVIMDIVHSHAVKNENEGLGKFDGSLDQYFYADGRREHPAWDSLCFDYGKNQVVHFLLSNCKYWMEVFKFDGFRFDGVTSMIYNNHGLGQDFGSYDDYYNAGQNGDAICYLTLANKLIHEVNPKAITIAEEMSGMPGVGVNVKNGGIGFDYRMAMGIPDYWIKLLKEKKDEDWNVTEMFWELTNRRADEKTISYAESHDQALVGDKTIIFRLIDEKMYWNMMRWDKDLTVDRGIALHKMIRLITASTINGGYLNFMGNEFGHPEWIDFPREGNNWSYKYARRQWSLVDRQDLKYQFLNCFDKSMVELFASIKKFEEQPISKIWDNRADQVLAYERNDLVFVFNFNPEKSFSDYGLLVPQGDYHIVLNTDSIVFGGFDRVNESVHYLTLGDPLYTLQDKGWLRTYLPARSALVFKKVSSKKGSGVSRKADKKTNKSVLSKKTNS